jgi:hypothetical protein
MPVSQRTQVEAYEEHLSRDGRWALSEGSQFFEGAGAVQQTLSRITRRLKKLNIPYSVVDGMALFHHGDRRFTEDIDLLVSREGLKQIHDALDGRGYLPPFTQSKSLRDTKSGVRIEFILTGDFPGDGKPKPVAFPDPTAASFEADGVRYLNLNSLIELKLASGISNPARLRDISDVMELIKALNLPLDYADRLNSYVQDKFHEVWNLAARDKAE